MTCGNFHDGSENRIASVHQNLCQSWENCYGNPHNDSTSLWVPNLESYAVVSVACPVQDRSHISWRWWTQGDPQAAQFLKLLHEFKTSSVRIDTDRPQHYWGGGNWLWDMPTGSDSGIQNIVDRCRHLYSSCGSAKHRYMVELPCLVSQCAKLHLAGWTRALHQSGIFGYHLVYSNCRVAATVHTIRTWCVWVHNCKYPA
jgi:hypothetical protein